MGIKIKEIKHIVPAHGIFSSPRLRITNVGVGDYSTRIGFFEIEMEEAKFSICNY